MRVLYGLLASRALAKGVFGFAETRFAYFQAAFVREAA